MIRLIATELSPSHPAVIAWARTTGFKPKTRWGIRLSDGGAPASLAGWENVTFGSWTKARKAIAFIEKTGGGFDDWQEKD